MDKSFKMDFHKKLKSYDSYEAREAFKAWLVAKQEAWHKEMMEYEPSEEEMAKFKKSDARPKAVTTQPEDTRLDAVKEMVDMVEDALTGDMPDFGKKKGKK